jgi:palmitoyl-protein thioesterase
MFRVIFLLFCTNVYSSSIYRPVVLMHGITSTAAGMDDVADWIRTSYPGIYIVSVEIGNGKLDSYLFPLDKQVNLFCETVESDVNLRQGFNLLGYSQGSIIVRGALERCSLPVFNLITLSGIHQGTFGVPYLTFIPEQYRQLISKYAYEIPVQNALSPPSYWRDPGELDRYIADCHFLPDINNEREPRNEIYRQNMIKLNSFVMTYSDIDEVIMPRQSGLFMGYQKNSLEVETWNNSRQFTEDLIGLRTLLEQGKLFTFTAHVKHQDVTHAPNKDFFMKNILSFFNNTLP